MRTAAARAWPRELRAREAAAMRGHGACSYAGQPDGRTWAREAGAPSLRVRYSARRHNECSDRNLKQREGFTLIELMIVVAIIGILAAIAIPNFIKFQLRSKAGEGKVNLAGIRTAEESYFAEAGTYLDWPARRRRPCVRRSAEDPVQPGRRPVARLRRSRRSRPVRRASAGSAGSPRATCTTRTRRSSACGGRVTVASPVSSNQFYAAAVADIDGDAVAEQLGRQPARHRRRLALGAPAGLHHRGVRTVGCGGHGRRRPGAGISVLGQVGPCDVDDMGRNVF